MTKFNFSDQYKKAEKEYNLGKGEYFKPQEGQNKVRLVSACLPHEGEYKGQRTFKWLCQVIDLKDGKVKPYFMPNTVYKLIEGLQMSDEYSFDEVPMPYDISVNAVNAGSKEVQYSVTPARQNRELTAEEQQAIKDAPTVQELQAKVRENDKGQNNDVAPLPVEPPKPPVEDEINIEDIPF